MKGSTRILLTIVGVVLMAAAVGFLVIYPMVRQMDADRTATQERQAKLARLDRVAQKISDLQQGIQRLNSALEFFENRLPKEREMDVILREVWQIAESKSLSTRSIRSSAPETTSRYMCQPIVMSLEGPFEGFYEFLLGLEQMPRLARVRQIQITKAPLTEGRVNVSLILDIYFEKSA